MRETGLTCFVQTGDHRGRAQVHLRGQEVGAPLGCRRRRHCNCPKPGNSPISQVYKVYVNDFCSRPRRARPDTVFIWIPDHGSRIPKSVCFTPGTRSKKSVLHSTVVVTEYPKTSARNQARETRVFQLEPEIRNPKCFCFKIVKPETRKIFVSKSEGRKSERHTSKCRWATR